MRLSLRARYSTGGWGSRGWFFGNGSFRRRLGSTNAVIGTWRAKGTERTGDFEDFPVLAELALLQGKGLADRVAAGGPGHG